MPGDLTIGRAWALTVADKVRACQARFGRDWISAVDYAAVYRYSRPQARHILNRAVEYGTLRRDNLTAVGLAAGYHGGARHAFTVAAA